MLEHTYHLRIEARLWNEFKQLAEERGETVAALLRRLVKHYVLTAADKHRFCITGEACTLALIKGFGSKLNP